MSSEILDDILGDLSFEDIDGEPQEPRIPHMIPGKVTHRNDPEGLGRVRINVLGLFEQSTEWMIPFTLSGGYPGRGRFSPPQVGALVALWFPLGEIGPGFYLATGWAKKSEVPNGAKVQGNQTRSVEEDGQWLLILDDIAGQGEWGVQHKTNGAFVQFLENGNFTVNPGNLANGFLSSGATQQLVRGNALLSYFNDVTTGLIDMLDAHVHSIPTGFSGPPSISFPKPTSAILSDIWKVK